MLSLLTNSFWNLIALSFTLGAHFITIPYVIHRIGVTEFGSSGLLLAAWAPLLLIGTVLGQSAVRIIAEKLAVTDKLGAQRICTVALYLCMVLGLVSGIVFVIVFFILFHFGVLSSIFIINALVTAIAGVAQQILIVLQSVVSAHQNFRMIAKLTAGSAVINILCIFLMVAWAPSIIGYLAGIATGFVGCMILWWGSTIKYYHLRLNSPAKELKELLRSSGWQSASQISGVLANQCDRYILGVISNIAVLGQFNVANRLQEALYVCVVKAGEVLFPHFSSMSRQDIKKQARVYLTASWVVMVFSVMALVPLIPLAHPILQLWVGDSVANGGALLLCTLVIAGLIGTGSNVYTYFAMGIGSYSSLAWISIFYSLLTIVLSIIAITWLGPYAAGLGMTLAGAVRVMLCFVVLRQGIFSFVPISQLMASTILPLLSGLVVASMWCSFSDLQVTGWISLFLAYVLISVSTGIVVILATLLTAFGRDLRQQVLINRDQMTDVKQS